MTALRNSGAFKFEEFCGGCVDEGIGSYPRLVWRHSCINQRVIKMDQILFNRPNGYKFTFQYNLNRYTGYPIPRPVYSNERNAFNAWIYDTTTNAPQRRTRIQPDTPQFKTLIGILPKLQIEFDAELARSLWRQFERETREER